MPSWDAIGIFVAGAFSTLVVSIVVQLASRWFTEGERLRLEPVGPTCAEIGGVWVFYYEFKPEIGFVRRENSAVVNAGGAVEVKSGSKSHHHAETIWAGLPVASTANLYAKKGLQVCIVFPKSHQVIFSSAGTAPHADQQRLGLDVIGIKGFDWDQCRQWEVQITAAAPGSGARTAKTTVERLCTEAKGATTFPGVGQIINDVNALPEGSIIKGTDDAIYCIQKGTKRLFSNPGVLISHHHTLADVVRVTERVITNLPTGDVMPLRLGY